MKQILIQILSTLVNSENKIEVKKPNINFDEGFRRFILVCIIIWVFCDIWSIITSEYRNNSEIFMALGGGFFAYICYRCLIKILSWIGAGFSGKKNKRTLLKEWQIKYKYWNRKCQRSYKKCNVYNEVSKKQESQIEYNRNPFIPKGRMRRFDYFVYSFLVGAVMRLIDYETEKNPETISYCIICLWLVTFVIGLFIMRNRIYDITLSNKKAWWLTGLFQLSGLILTSLHPALIYLAFPFGIAIWLIPSKISGDKQIENTDKKGVAAFDMIKTMRN